MKRSLSEALEAVQSELRKIEFYGQAAEDNLERLQGTLSAAQRTDVDRLDHSVVRLRALTRRLLRRLDALLRKA